MFQHVGSCDKLDPVKVVGYFFGHKYSSVKVTGGGVLGTVVY